MIRKILNKMICLVLVAIVVVSICGCNFDDNNSKRIRKRENSDNDEATENEEVLDPFERRMNDLGYDRSDYPYELLALFDRNEETEDFVLSYPFEVNKNHKIDLSMYSDTYSIPRLVQWDKRWGYESYNGTYMALSGCGPTCLSMVAIYLTGNSEYNPLWVASFLDEHGYAVENCGTAWSIFGDGIQCIDIYGYELGSNTDAMTSYLQSGYPIICSMGPGDFTDEGHFVVIESYEDGYFDIIDPNSVQRSRKWKIEDIESQIANSWAMYKLDDNTYCYGDSDGA